MINSIIESLKNDRSFTSCVAHWETIPPREGKYTDFPADIDSRLKSILEKRGISRLYSHQAECYEKIKEGKNVVVVSPTASGKTLAYNLPVLQSLLGDESAKALYLFPTKALSQDQQSELNEVIMGSEVPVRIFTYDGDTPSSIRVSAREQGRIIITNPDMLHTGILPNHPKWIKIFKSLKFIVIDEIHIYRGIFGSHFTNVIRRLKRIAAFYGARPQFICCSATIGNPLDLAEKIIEEKACIIDKSGAPTGERHFILYNPPIVDAVQGIRRGVTLESERLATRLLKQKIKTIVFARSRVRTELIASYIKKSLANIYTDNGRIKIASYRGGYLPNERRAIEKGLREGDIQGVVSTNALELGIDIGGLDASIMAGFPGTISSCWQQAGRAGRRNTVSLNILIASSSPLDQYLMQHPEYFFGKSPESARIDPDNLYILTDQLKCSLFELPFRKEDLFRPDLEEILNMLEENGTIRFTQDKWFWADQSYPAEGVSLRTSTQENVVIIDTTKGKNAVIGEMDLFSAKMLIHDDAIYIHLGNQYTVKKLDAVNLKCYVEEADTGYYTDSIVKADIHVLEKDIEKPFAKIKCVVGDILVRMQVTKFKKLRYHTHENIGYGEVNLPPEEMHTRSIILLFDESTEAYTEFNSLDENGKALIISRLGYLLKHVAPVFLLCDSNDIGIAERLKDPFFDFPCLYIFDNYPGGTGLSEGILEHLDSIMKGALEVIDSCPCKSGCPACIGPQDNRDHRPTLKNDLAGFIRKIV